jgi:hypothetical protein
MRTLGISGLNETMPHKQAVIPYLDALDETAREIRAVNTNRPFARLCVRRHLGSDTARRMPLAAGIGRWRGTGGRCRVDGRVRAGQRRGYFAASPFMGVLLGAVMAAAIYFALVRVEDLSQSWRRRSGSG